MKTFSLKNSCLAFLLSASFLFLNESTTAQKQRNIWYFGANAGVDFNGGAPVALTNANTSYYPAEGCASIANPSTGALLFYCDGQRVFDKTHTQMPNGSGLNGNFSSTQAALIVPFVNNPNKYYIFTTDLGGFSYSVVDMTLNSGNGDITSKNINLAASTCEKITAVKHANCTDIWVIDHGMNNNTFHAFLITSTGVSNVPVISNTGMVPVAFGYIKASNKGKKLALISYSGTNNNAQLFDFNNSTGVISNPLNISNNISDPYSIAFSGNDSLFYVGYVGGVNQYQTYSTNLPSTEKTIMTTFGLAVLQLGPNCKIYCIPYYGATSLGVINNPNSISSPGYVANAISLGGKSCTNGLPDFMSDDRDYQTKFSIGQSTCSLTVQFTDSTKGLACSGGPTSWQWSFGDPASGIANTSSLQNASHLFTAAGTYSVKLLVKNACKTDSVTKIITVGGQLNAVATTISNVTCSNSTSGSASVTASGGSGAYTYSWNNGQAGVIATGLSAGNYTVTVTNSGCSQTATISISGSLSPTLTINSVDNNCFGSSNGSATVNASGGTQPYTYSWSNSSTQAAANNLMAGNYTVTITDANGCTSIGTVSIKQPSSIALQISSISATCGQNNGTASLTANGGSGAYQYSWTNTAQTTSFVTGLAAGTYTATVTDNSGCTNKITVVVNSVNSAKATFIASDTAGCSPLCILFSNTTANGLSYSWDFGDGSIGSAANENHCYKIPGTYSVTLTVTDKNGCISFLTKNNWITVYPNPVADFTANPQPATILNPTISFTDQSIGANTWLWSFGDLGNSGSILQNPVFTYPDSGCYIAALHITNSYGCTDSARKSVCIKGDYEIFVPNAFTPSADGLNDLFLAKGTGIDPNDFQMMIFDRWGNLIWQTNELSKGWDGRANGGSEVAQMDVYVWKIRARELESGKLHQYLGHVSLLK